MGLNSKIKIFKALLVSGSTWYNPNSMFNQNQEFNLTSTPFTGNFEWKIPGPTKIPDSKRNCSLESKIWDLQKETTTMKKNHKLTTHNINNNNSSDKLRINSSMNRNPVHKLTLKLMAKFQRLIASCMHGHGHK